MRGPSGDSTNVQAKLLSDEVNAELNRLPDNAGAPRPVDKARPVRVKQVLDR
jgi:hypothetical protein